MGIEKVKVNTFSKLLMAIFTILLVVTVIAIFVFSFLTPELNENVRYSFEKYIDFYIIALGAYTGKSGAENVSLILKSTKKNCKEEEAEDDL